MQTLVAYVISLTWNELSMIGGDIPLLSLDNWDSQLLRNKFKGWGGGGGGGATFYNISKFGTPSSSKPNFRILPLSPSSTLKTRIPPPPPPHALTPFKMKQPLRTKHHSRLHCNRTALFVAQKSRFDLQASWVINNVLGLFLEILSLGVCTTRHWQTSGRLVQESNVCTVTPINQTVHSRLPCIQTVLFLSRKSWQ